MTPEQLKSDLATLLKQGLESKDAETKQLAATVNMVLAISKFGPDVFHEFFVMFIERVEALCKIRGVMQKMAKELGI